MHFIHKGFLAKCDVALLLKLEVSEGICYGLRERVAI